MILGMRIVESPYALEETTERLFPDSRHRSRRIRKKLIKRFGGEFRKRPAAFHNIATGELIVHPAIADQIRREIQVKQDHEIRRAFRYGAPGEPLMRVEVP